MLRITRLWRGIAPLTLGGLILTGATTRGDDASPLARQLTDLGRQALAQGQTKQARTFFLKALELDPNDARAKRGMADREVIRVALQDPAAPAPAPADAPATPAPAGEAPPSATLDEASKLENVARQQLIDDVRQRLQEARNLVSAGQPETALNVLRLVQNVVRSSDKADEATKTTMDRQIQAQYLSTVRAEERIVTQRAERLRQASNAEQQARTLDTLLQNQQTVSAMMTQFDSLMAQGIYNVLYNGGAGDIAATTIPFLDANDLARETRPLLPDDPVGYAGMFTARSTGFLAQELAFEQLKEYRFMLTMQDVSRANVPFPDNKVIEYPDAERWRSLSERRIKRYGRAVDLLDRDPKTKSIIAKLDEPISMSFGNETPLEDVLKYIKSATQGPNDNGIPIYVDPVGLQEAEKTMTSPITLDLEGVPLKTTLRLMLKQLGLTYTVKDGLMTITSEDSNDQPTEIRVYPVADLAIIPISLMGGGGGGMGGGMGGGGMGGGGMGGGGMGGGGMGGGGMGGGGMGGMMSMPVQDPADASGTFMEKKSN